MPFKCQGHPVSLWRWPLTCNLEKCYSLRSFFGMYNLERPLRYLHLLTRHCPCNLLPRQPLINMNIEGNFEATLWRHRWCHHHGNFFWHNLGCFFHIWGQIETVFNISKWPPFWARDKLFCRKWYRKLNIPERRPLVFPTFWAFDRRFSSNIDGDISISKFDPLCDLVTSPMTSWIRIDINVVIVSWYLCTGSLMMISLLIL